jgi:hypothetical protein
MSTNRSFSIMFFWRPPHASGRAIRCKSAPLACPRAAGFSLLSLAGVLALTILSACSRPPQQDEHLLEKLMKTEPQHFQKILNHPEQWEVQILYTQINRDSANRPRFTSFTYRCDSSNYFYPASTVKLPLVLLALEKINNMGKEELKQAAMRHDSAYSGQVSVRHDSTSASGLPSVLHYSKKIMVVSDNDAYNRLYEFLGQEAANRSLRSKGYNMRILHRLERPLSPDENRHTEAVSFLNGNQVIWQQPSLVNTDSIRPTRLVKRGKGFMRGDSLVNEPFDFTYKNFYPLEEQQEILQAILFPESVPPTRRFNLTEQDRKFIWQYMSQLPRETLFPPYYQDTLLYDAYCKFLMYGDDRAPIPANVRIFNKVGDAYGYLIDNAYIVDFEHGVEFMLSAVINTNTDGIYNDGIYEYKTVGFPFMRHLGQLIYRYERGRTRPRPPDLSAFRLTYDR